jgi:hypothetical protein
MTKKSVIFLLSLLLSSCTFPILIPSTDINSGPLASGSTSRVLAATLTHTAIPTLPTATFTETPTLIYLDSTPTIATEGTATVTLAPIIVFTETLAPLFASTQDITGTPPVQTVPENSLFTTISISGGRVFWGACEPSYVKITAHITDLSKIYIVTLWLRLANKTTGDTTDWGGGAIMYNDKKGNFTYTLSAKSFSHYREYINAWGQYQLVASDRSLDRIGASAQYLNNLSVTPCP